MLIYPQRNCMLFRNKIFLITMTLVINHLALKPGTQELKKFEEISFEEVAITADDDDLDDLADLDIENLRDFDLDAKQEMTLKEKTKLIIALLQVKTRGYPQHALNHLLKNGNEYLLGSFCIGSMVTAAFIKYCLKRFADVNV